MRVGELPRPLPEWEKLSIPNRLSKIQKAYEIVLSFLESGEWIKEAEERCSPHALSWEVLNAEFYQTFPMQYPRTKWLNAQWTVLFSGFLKQLGK